MGCFEIDLHRKSTRTKVLLRIIFDVTCIILVSSGIFAIKFGSKPYTRGFFCNDDSIKHPVLPDTVSFALAASVGVLLPLCVIIFLEFFLRKGRTVCIVSRRNYFLRSKSWIEAAYRACAVFIFGIAVTAFLTEIGKYSVGRLRPHFYTLCNPDVKTLKCEDGYITLDVCTSKDVAMMTEARLSFPSGHSSFSMYSMLYLILYLQARIACRPINLLKPLVQLILFTMAFFTCLSRISDYKHHWSDVLAGSVLGIVVCVCITLGLTDFGKFLCSNGVICRNEDDDLMQEENVTIVESSDVPVGNNFVSMSHEEASVPTSHSRTHTITMQ